MPELDRWPEMAITRLQWLPFASLCMMLAMFVAVGMSEPSWTYVHSPTSTLSPKTGTEDGDSAAAAAADALSSSSHHNIIACGLGLPFASLSCVCWLKAASIRIMIMQLCLCLVRVLSTGIGLLVVS